MYNEVTIKGLRQTDRVFECQGQLVKVRLEKKEIFQREKIYGPAALSIKFTASVCDTRGKAIPRADGRFCILPQTVTIPVMEIDSEKNLAQDLDKILTPLIAKAAMWQKAMENAEKFMLDWEKKKPSQKRNTRRNN